MAKRTPRTTVVILTYNGERYIGRILDALAAQDYAPGFEVLVIDSGSTDKTLDTVRLSPDVRLHEIPNSEFGHGKTRNLAATLAKGEYVAYLTHDAVPVGPHWIEAITAPLELSPRVAAVVGRQHPRPDALPFVRYGVIGTFAMLGSPHGTTLVEKRGDEPLGFKGFFSDVASATRRSLLVGEIPYRDVDYAEDQWFGRDILTAGYIKAYAGEATVEHSNDLTLKTLGPRIFDETLGLRRAGLLEGAPSRMASTRHVIRAVLAEWWRLLRDRELPRGRRLRWLPSSPVAHIRAERSKRRALTIDVADAASHRHHSLEGQLRADSGD